MLDYVLLFVKILLTVLILFGAWFSFELIKLKRFYGKLKRLGIPGPEPSIAKCGNLMDIFDDPKEDIIGKWLKEHGDVIGFYLDNQIHMATNDLDLLKTIFVDKQNVFTERQDLLYNDIFSHSLLFARKDRWKPLRRLYNVFLNSYGSNSKEVVDSIKSSSQELLEWFRKNAVEQNGKLVAKDVDIIMLMQAFFLKTFVNLSMPELEGCEIDPKNEFVQLPIFADSCLYDIAAKYPFLAPFIEKMTFILPYLEYHKRLDTILENKMKEIRPYLKMRRQMGSNYKAGQSEREKALDEMYTNNENRTYMKCFLFTIIKDYDEGKINYNELRANLFMFVQGSYDSISYVYISMLWVLGKYPDIQEKVRDEIKKHGHESTYLDQFIEETTRIFPMVGFSIRRKSTRPVSIKGYNFPAGTVFVYHPISIGKNPSIWPDPEKFDPDRFRKGADLHPCASRLFGFGAKVCPAQKFSFNIFKISLAEILLKCRIVNKSPENLVQQSLGPDLVVPSEKIYTDFEFM